LSDLLESHGHKVFGTCKNAAILEGSKAFSKDFMKRHQIPTANYANVDNYDDAVEQLKNFSYPVVIKAAGLAVGKGVVICDSKEMAITTLKEMMLDDVLKGAASKVIIEEFLVGFECSLLCFTDGNTIVPMVYAKDHKQIYDGNQGLNTGGMGTVSPNPFMPNDMDEILREDILNPFIEGLKKDNIDYRGVLFIGLMIDGKKAKVLEFNVRFGDPETQVILLRLESDLFDVMNAVSNKTLSEVEVKWNDKHAFCLVLASAGYPLAYEKGKVITGLSNLDSDVIIFHAGTKQVGNDIVTSGGRVLNICSLADSFDSARELVYKAANKVDFEGKYYRKDIGLA
jgi:phosphoribosylamine--glycine ligase